VQPIKTISGTVKLPGSKSLSNRILLLAALAEGTTVVRNLLVRADDVQWCVWMVHVSHSKGARIDTERQ
jgi:3-phosphoshikimate 1-carboxyvinyltransferase